ncbi:MAG: hypothetical protein H0V17_11055 [Deltaproteobacteria bacterium]|nr:hypothetical protein [Deltaproteobacteria bacterium]
MGADFIRKKNHGFIRQRERRFAEQTATDLLGTIRPEMRVNLCGRAIGPVRLADELWTPTLKPDGPIDFFVGTEPSVRLEGAAAEHLRGQCANSRAVVARVVDLEQEHGLVTLTVGVDYENH